MAIEVSSLERLARHGASFGADDQRFWNAVDQMTAADPSALDQLASALINDETPKVRELWAAVLGRVAENRPDDVPRNAAATLLKWLEDPTAPSVLVAAIGALRRLETPDAIDAMARLVEHPNIDVREQLAQTLATLLAKGVRHDAATFALASMSADPSRHVREWATHGLGSVIDPGNDERIAELLKERSHDSDRAVRIEALKGLARLGDKQALLSVIEDPADVDNELLTLAAEHDPDWELHEALSRLSGHVFVDPAVLQRALDATGREPGELLERIRRELDERLNKLRGSHEEYERLASAKVALDATDPRTLGPSKRSANAAARQRQRRTRKGREHQPHTESSEAA